MTDPAAVKAAHRVDKALALLKSLAADHEPGIGDHEWRTCRACLASEELGHTKTGELSSPAQRSLRVVAEEMGLLAARIHELEQAEAEWQTRVCGTCAHQVILASTPEPACGLTMEDSPCYFYCKVFGNTCGSWQGKAGA